jgi:hypothetical protein
MDYLIIFFFLIISCVIGISIALFLNMKSYLGIALVCTIIFIGIELYYNYQSTDSIKPNNTIGNISINNIVTNLLSKIKQYNPISTMTPSMTPSMTITADGSLITSLGANPNTNSIPDYHLRHTEEGNRFATQKDLEENNYSIFKHKKNNSDGKEYGKEFGKEYGKEYGKEFDMDKPPFDGLEPTELLSRLNYIYYATANPAKMVNYHDFQTHADRYLDADGTKLSTNDPKLQTYSAGFYPQLTTDQIDARDCLNEGSGPRSCFQSPQLFYNKEHNFNILEKGVNTDNANLIIREDFSMPMNLDIKARYDPVLFMNAPKGNLDKPLDQQSNESIDLSAEELSLCRNCKLAVCKDDYCSLQNALFM